MAENSKKMTIYAITAYTIFQKCFENAGLLNNGELKRERWAFRLKEKLEEKYGEELENNDTRWPDYQNYLRDRYNEVLKFIQEGNPKRKIGVLDFKFKPLLEYSGIEDYLTLNDSFAAEKPVDEVDGQDIVELNAITDNTGGPVLTDKTPDAKPIIKQFIEPVSIPVLYSSQTFGRFDILRNPNNGFIYFYPNGDFVFEGDDISLFIRGTAFIRAIRHSMYGDNDLWVKVDYERDRKMHTVYFAGIKPEAGVLKLCEPGELLRYLNKEKA